MFNIEFPIFVMIVCIGVGLSVDAVLISISNSISYKNFNSRNAVLQSFIFGLCQCVAPIIGHFLGYAIKETMTHYDHWIAFFLLATIGTSMIMQRNDDNLMYSTKLSLISIIIQGISTSIDALAVGVSFAILEINILFAGIIIGIITFLLCLISSMLGAVAIHYLGDKFQKKATCFGGILLILIGLNILFSHLFF